jgi:hypothetical protein
MRFLLLTFFLLGLTTNQSDKSTIRIKIRACSNAKWQYSGTVYLLKDGKAQDSIITFRYVSNILFSYYKRDYDFKFENLTPGQYQVKYRNSFNVDSLVTIDLTSETGKTVEICFDKLADTIYDQESLLDNLSSGDTLRINCYIAAGGEFGGYDEGLWITKQGTKYLAMFYSLPNTYGMGWDINRIEIYEQHSDEIEQKSSAKVLTENQVEDVNKFLIEIEYYRTGTGWTNAPEFFSIYSKTDTIRRVKIDSRWKPYITLRQEI